MRQILGSLGPSGRNRPSDVAVVQRLPLDAGVSPGKLSNHGWGSAIDMKIGSVLAPLGARFSVKGVDALVPYFNAAGWYWGGGYHGRKDPMHFECGSALPRTFA